MGCGHRTDTLGESRLGSEQVSHVVDVDRVQPQHCHAHTLDDTRAWRNREFASTASIGCVNPRTQKLVVSVVLIALVVVILVGAVAGQ